MEESVRMLCDSLSNLLRADPVSYTHLKTRIVPVTMASGTTILGMLPLLGDAMFAGIVS